MTDRELLELAAKAAGTKIDKSPHNGGGYGNTGFDVDGNAVLDWHNNRRWNPLTDDGDALRLAVKLELLIHIETCYYVSVCKDNVSITEHIGNDGAGCLYVATRRAIVRAAAEIGRSMK